MYSFLKASVTAVLLFVVQFALAQITISESDVPTVGQTLMYESVPGIVNVSLGSSGPNQTWILPDYDWDAPYPVQVIDPSGTPYTSDFPTANRCLYGFNDDFGVEGVMYNYQRVADNGFYNLGLVVVADEITQNFVFPDEALFAPLPLTYGTNWTMVASYEIEWNGFEATRVDSAVKTVDAWGTVQTDEGDFATLRVYSQNWSTIYLPSPLPSQTIRDISFTWFSEDGVAGLMIESLEGVTSPTFTQGYVSAVRVGVMNTEPVRGPVSASFSVGQNYPNPFNPVTNLPIKVEQLSPVSVIIYNELGEIISQQEITLGPGEHSLPIDGSQWASGAYFAQIQTGELTATKRMLLIK